MSEKLLRSLLDGTAVPELRWFETIGSTNDEALVWAAQGAEEYSLVAANHQSAGRGRMARNWITKPDAALACSLILHPTKEEQERINLFSPLAALALCKTLEKDYHLVSQIKWPNDVLINNKKTAGILVESNWQGDEAKHVIVGIGINVKPEAIPNEVELLFPATSVQSALQISIDRFALLRSFLQQIINWRQRILKSEFLDAYQDRLAFINEPVSIHQEGRPTHSGIIRGVTPNGDLKLQTGEGQQIEINVGDVHLRPRSN